MRVALVHDWHVSEAGYAEALAAQQRGLASLCATAGWSLGLHRTDHPPEAALLGLYTALSPA